MSLRIGILGAGPWASEELGPAISELPELFLAGVWSRSEERARAAATALNAAAFAQVDALISECDAVVLAVAPSAQPELAIRAAAAGRAVWCEKPLALNLPEPEQFAAAIHATGAPTFFHLPYRESAEVQALARWAGESPIDHVNVRFLSGALLRDAPESTGWRSGGDSAEGVLLDLGPHGFGLAKQVAGPIRTVAAKASRTGWHVYCQHEACTSTTALMARVAIAPSITDVDVMADDHRGTGRGYRHANARAETRRARTLRALNRFASIVDSGLIDHPFNIDAGVHLQAVLEATLRSAQTGREVDVQDHPPMGAS